MSILTKTEILDEMKQGNIKIEPFVENQMGPGSVDLRLGNEFLVFKKVRDIVDITEDITHEDYTEKVFVKDGDRIILMPGDTILGITVERITLAENISGWLEGRSRFARMGLLVHISASFIQPGINNKQCLEITNFSSMPLALHPGTKICQFIFQKLQGSAKYSGRFADQDEKNF